MCHGVIKVQTNIPIVNRGFKELNPVVCGYANNKTDGFGPAIREYFLIHYVRKGKGVLYNSDGAHKVAAGQIFIIYPEETTRYEPDKDDPWSYIWIGFDGSMAPRMYELDKCVIDYPDDTFTEIMTDNLPKNTCEEFVLGKLFVIFSHIFNEVDTSPSYEKQISDYIKANYMNQISVEAIADMIGLDRRYMSKLFKQKIGMTVREFLINTRLNAAKKYLKQGKSVAETALLSGYTDVFNFSKMFKKIYGMSPKKYAAVNQNILR